MNKILISILLVLFSCPMLLAQEWVVPEEYKNMPNPSTYNLDNVNKGKDLYIKNCKSCHGDAGKNNALPLVPPPPDVTSDVMQANTEGDLYYKITKGRGGMPQFETSLSDDDRWRLVNYIMNYNSANEPVLVEAPPVKAKIMASVNEREKLVEVFAEFENKEGNYVKLTEAPVTISAKKAFGNLVIGQALTSETGRAEFSIPESVIGDEEGYVSIVVSMGENYMAEDVVLEKARVGQLKKVPQLIKKEILWSTNENIQVWLLLSYLGATGAAWLAIAYVVFLIARIKKTGRN